MPSGNADVAVKYVATLDHVREVALRGTADLAYWTERLATEGLTPNGNAGQARLLITAAEGKFKGIRFRELSFAVLATHGDRQGAFLVQAFNSNRFFAFCERVFFSTPYRAGDVRLDVSTPASIRLLRDDTALFVAAMGNGRSPTRTTEDGWDGPVFLPGSKWFHAKIHGHTLTFPFQPGVDELTIKPSGDNPILQALVDSHFVAKEWAVRPDAHHAKSKTYSTPAGLSGG